MPRGVHKVQDVVLSDRSELVTDSGLNIPMTPQILVPSNFEFVPYSGPFDGWFPQQNYRWETLENPDGSSTLTIIMYPFFYDPSTTDIRFYKNYSFDIHYAFSELTTVGLSTDKQAYRPGEPVTVRIEVENSGEAQDIIFDAVIKRYGTEEIIDGLSLWNLEDLAGKASFSAQWESHGLDEGYYAVEVNLTDAGGNMLGRKTAVFELGISAGEISEFTASPQHFDIGDLINISLAFRNSGTADVTGTAMIKIQDATGETIKALNYDIPDLKPENEIGFDDVWETSGIAEGTYRIVACVLYDDKATNLKTLIVSTIPPCKSDFDGDKDVDGSDLAAYAADSKSIALEDFSVDFGRTDCP
jgi:hypothetical protein